MNTKSNRGVAGLLLVVLVLVAACSSDGEPRRPVALPTSPTELPEFTPERFQELLAGLEGKPVLVNFWGSWCPPCFREAPAIARAAREFEGRVQFLGVDISDQLAPAREFVRQFGWTFPSVFDPDNKILASLDLLGAPVTIIFDASGDRTFALAGEITEEQLVAELEKVAGP